MPSPDFSPKVDLEKYRGGSETTLTELNDKCKDDVNDFVVTLRKVDDNDKITTCPPSNIGGRPQGLSLPGGGLKLGAPGGGGKSRLHQRARGLNLGIGGSSDEDRLAGIKARGLVIQQKIEESDKNSFESKYVLGKMLGEGCMGAVYKCFKKHDTDKK